MNKTEPKNEPAAPELPNDDDVVKLVDEAPATYSRPHGRFGGVLAVTGVVLLCTVILAPIGLVLSLLGYIITRRSGVPSRLGLIGLVGNSLVTFIVAAVSLYLIFFAPELTDDFIKRLVVEKISIVPNTQPDPAPQTVAGKTAATEVAKRSSTYQDKNGIYPLILTDFERNTETSLKTLSDVIISPKPLDVTTGYSTRRVDGQDVIVSHLVVYACGATEGNKIGYWNTQANEVAFTYAGVAGDNSTCAIMK